MHANKKDSTALSITMKQAICQTDFLINQCHSNKCAPQLRFEKGSTITYANFLGLKTNEDQLRTCNIHHPLSGAVGLTSLCKSTALELHARYIAELSYISKATHTTYNQN